jgi:hypothetical protein
MITLTLPAQRIGSKPYEDVKQANGTELRMPTSGHLYLCRFLFGGPSGRIISRPFDEDGFLSCEVEWLTA